MNIKILSPEESLQYWNDTMELNRKMNPEEIKHMCQLVGGTKYIIGKENWDEFFEWIYSVEGKAEWQRHPELTDYVRGWWERKQKQL